MSVKLYRYNRWSGDKDALLVEREFERVTESYAIMQRNARRMAAE